MLEKKRSRTRILIALARKEIYENLRSFKFICYLVSSVGLVLLSTSLLSREYLDEVNEYYLGTSYLEEQLTKVPVYSLLEYRCFRKPNPYRIIISRGENENGKFAAISHREVPFSLRGTRIKNEFMRVLSFYDLKDLVSILLSLLAILLSYNSISAEKEEGTLSLIFANSIPRYVVLIGKYIGLMVTLTIPVTILMITSVIVALLFKCGRLDYGLIGSMVLVYLASFLYLSIIILVGLIVSAKSGRSSLSLLCLLALYISFILLSPSEIGAAKGSLNPRTPNYYETALAEIENEKEKKLEIIAESLASPKTWRLSSGLVGNASVRLMKRITPPEYLEYLQNLYRASEGIVIEYAAKADEYRRNERRRTLVKARTITLLSYLLPSVSYSTICAAVAGTDEREYDRFMNQVLNYWRQYCRYMQSKDAFGVRFFYPYSKPFDQEELSLISKISQDKAGNTPVGYRGKYYGEATRANPDYDYLDLRDMPRFEYQESGLLERIKPIIINIAILIMFNFVLFLLAYVSLITCDARRHL